jgi:hypothetical protein
MVSTVKVTNIDTPDNTGNVTFDRPIVGDGSGLTSLSAANITSGGTLPTLNGSGLTSVTPADTSSFYAYKGVVQANIATGVSTTVIFGSEAFDKGGNFASNTFTAPTTGKYVLIWTSRVDQLDSAAGLFWFSIQTSNREMRVFLDPDFMAADCSRYPICLSGVFDMDASDTAYCYIRQDGGTAQMDIQPNSFFSGYFLGS